MTILDEGETKVIPPYSFDLQTTHFRKSHKFAVAFYGKKTIQKEEAHIDHIGNESSICRNLYGLGYTLQSIGVGKGRTLNLGLTEYSNHIWLPQMNKSSETPARVLVCINCGSLMMEDDDGKEKFYPYTDLDNNANKKEKKKQKEK